MPSSQNGWPVRTTPSALVSLDWITGRVAPGDVWTIFDHLCQRFDLSVENIRKDWSWGWNYRPIRGQSGGFSNHASGTAIDLNAPKHPLGVRGTFTREQVDAIHLILGELEGVVRWGGDYQNRADEMHFEINASPDRVAEVARRIQEDDMAYTNEDRQRDEAFIDLQKRRADRTLKFQKTVLRALAADDKDHEQIKADLVRLIAELDDEGQQ